MVLVRRGIAAACLLLMLAGLVTGLASGREGESLVQRLLIGRSVRGRPIYAYRLGAAGARPVLVVGCTDGDEPAGIAIVAALRKLQPPKGVSLWLLPTIN